MEIRPQAGYASAGSHVAGKEADSGGAGGSADLQHAEEWEGGVGGTV